MTRRLLHTLTTTAAVTALVLSAAAETLADGLPLPEVPGGAPPLRPTAQIANASAAPQLKPLQAQDEEEERGEELPDDQPEKRPTEKPREDTVRGLEQSPPQTAPFPTAPARAAQQRTAAPRLPRTGADGLTLLLAGLALGGSGLVLRRTAA